MKKVIYNWGPLFAYAALIYFISSFRTLVPVTGQWDKVVHFFEYALFGFLATRAFLLTKDFSRFWGTALGASLGIAFGILDEFHQSFVPGREATVGDAIADGLGAIAGALFFTYLGTYLYRSKKLYPGSENPCETCPAVMSPNGEKG